MATSTGVSAGATNDPVEAVTGKPWTEWQTVLDTWKGDKQYPNAITIYLMRHYRLPRFWAQAVELRYLRQRRKRNDVSLIGEGETGNGNMA
jgi:hypothetical protein